MRGHCHTRKARVERTACPSAVADGHVVAQPPLPDLRKRHVVSQPSAPVKRARVSTDILADPNSLVGKRRGATMHAKSVAAAPCSQATKRRVADIGASLQPLQHAARC